MRFSLSSIAIIAFTSLGLAGDIPAGDVTFAEFQAYWNEAKADTAAKMVSVRWLQMVRTKNNGLDSNIVFAMAEDGIKPECHKEIRWLAQRMLSFINNDLSRSLLKQYLNDDDENLRMRIAIDLLHFGEWEVAAPVIAASREMGVLAMMDTARARPYIESALESGDPEIRFQAAYALANFYHDHKGIDRDFDGYNRKQQFVAAYMFGADQQMKRKLARDFLLSSDLADIVPSHERYDAVRLLEHDPAEEDVTVFTAVVRNGMTPRIGREVIFAIRALRDLEQRGSQAAGDSLAAFYETEWWTDHKQGIENFQR